MSGKTIVVVNGTGRQAASLVRVAQAVGYKVHAQIRQEDINSTVGQELRAFPNVTIIVGSLEDPKFVSNLFFGAQLAFVNTTSWGDETAIGRSLAEAAKRAGIQHYIYSSMPDHSTFGRGWPSLPLWSCKFTVEQYVRQLGMVATFVYAGIYNNNFTSLPYPLFCMELQRDGSFEWKAPFHPDVPIPWLDADHDVGPAVLQIFKDGPRKWNGQRIALAFEVISPQEACAAFSRGVNRPVRYRHVSEIEIKVPIPAGYRQQLDGITVLFGKYRAPYFGLGLEAPQEALKLWEGYRGLEEYAREVFPVEERLNGMNWMDQ